MNSVPSTTQGFWRSVPPFAAGVPVGLLVLMTLRVGYYDLMQLRPNMGPQIAFLFFPVLLVPLLIVALPLEALLRHIFPKPSSRGQLFLIGSSHALLLSWWAFPSHWWLVGILNPLVVRWLLELRRA